LEAIVINRVPFHIDLESLEKTLHFETRSPLLQELLTLVEEAERIGRPKALYKLAFIDEKGEDSITVEGVKFKSRILRINVEKAQRVFPYLVTCGLELEDWAGQITDVLKRFWAETIKEMAMRSAHRVMEEHLTGLYEPGKLSRMSPGSLADWPIQEQRPLFKILGNTEEMIGVHLTESLLMVPTKSVSGIRFPTEESFESCQLCPREECPNRRAPYEADLYNQRYRKE
jgi:Vitamin B12 dependent methionine synthase, activation domain